MLKVKRWFKELFFSPAAELAAEGVESEALAVFTTYYQFHIVRYDPTFMLELATMSTNQSWTDVIAAMSHRYKMPVPANTSLSIDKHVYERIRDVLVEIESGHARTISCGPVGSRGRGAVGQAQ